MTIELYVFPPSPRALKVLAVASHLGIDYAQRMVDLVKGDQKTPEYAELNPNMRMPTLKEGEYVLWESSAILQYLAMKKPEAGLLPSDERGRLDVTRWQFWDVAHWDPACATFMFEYIAKPLVLGINEPDEAALEKGIQQFHRIAKVLEGHLHGRSFVTGDKLTLADFSIAAPLVYAEKAHLPLGEYGEIRRWYAAIGALPAWQKTLAAAVPPGLA